jgi:hypothetical protein
LEVHNGYIEKTENFWRIVYDPEPGEGDGIKGLYHFKMVAASETTIRVLGGSRIRDVAGAMNRVPLTGDGGDSPTWDLFKTVTISASVYVWVEFDDALNPATLTVNTNAAYPDPDNGSEKLVLGYVTFSGGKITEIEQYWTGGDWRDQWEKLDGHSLEYHPTNYETQLRGMDDPSAHTIPSLDDGSDYFPIYDATDGNLKWYRLQAFSEWLDTYWSATPPTEFLLWKNLQDTVGDPSLAANVGYIPIVTHQGASVYKLELTDGSATGPWWKLGNTTTADAYGDLIGDGSQNEVINLNAQTLKDGASLGAWSVENTCELHVDDTANAGGAVDAGCLQLQGGMSGKGNSYFNDGTFALEMLSGVCLDLTENGATMGAQFLDTGEGWGGWVFAPGGGGTQEIFFCDGTYAANAHAGPINAEGGYYDNGTAGIDHTTTITLVDTNGNEVDIKFSGGLVIAG